MFKRVQTIGWFLLAALPLSAQQQHHQQPLVTFESPTKCKSEHGVWRWAAKTVVSVPPPQILADHRIKPSDIAAWEVPDRDVKTRTPRFGRELEFFELTGKVVKVKAEEDGDLHIELVDADNPRGVHVVVEVPLDHHGGDTPWNPIRERAFGWSTQKFPFETRAGHALHLVEHPVIRVTGQAFYDAEHKGPTPNRRRQTDHVSVWEIHPVIALDDR